MLVTRALSQSVICENNNGNIIVKDVYRNDDQMVIWTNEETSYIIDGFSWDGNKFQMKSLNKTGQIDSNHFLSWAVNYPGLGKRLLFVDYDEVLFRKMINFANYFFANRWMI